MEEDYQRSNQTIPEFFGPCRRLGGTEPPDKALPNPLPEDSFLLLTPIPICDSFDSSTDPGIEGRARWFRCFGSITAFANPEVIHHHDLSEQCQLPPFLACSIFRQFKDELTDTVAVTTEDYQLASRLSSTIHTLSTNEYSALLNSILNECNTVQSHEKPSTIVDGRLYTGPEEALCRTFSDYSRNTEDQAAKDGLLHPAILVTWCGM